MDVFAITKVASDTAQGLVQKLKFTQKSTFVDFAPPPPSYMPQEERRLKVSDVLSFILGVLIGVYAAYLSWQCNSKLKYNTFLKAIFAVFAYIFGLVYLILYVVMRWDICRKL